MNFHGPPSNSERIKSLEAGWKGESIERARFFAPFKSDEAASVAINRSRMVGPKIQGKQQHYRPRIGCLFAGRGAVVVESGNLFL